MTNRSSDKKGGNSRLEKQKKRQRIIAGTIAIILAAAMILTLLIAAIPAGAETLPALSASEPVENTEHAALEAVTSDSASHQIYDTGKKTTERGRVFIGDVDVTGMTAEQMKTALDRRLTQEKASRIYLYAGDNSAFTTAGSLGIKCDPSVEIAKAASVENSGNIYHRFLAKTELDKGNSITFDLDYTVSKKDIEPVLTKLESQLNSEPVPNGLVRTEDGFHITDRKDGVNMDAEASADAVKNYLEKQWNGGTGGVEVTYNTEPAEDTRESLKKISAIRGDATGTYNPDNTARADNLIKTCKAIDGTLLYPGEQFDFNDVTGERNSANGYREARPDEDSTSEPTFEEGSGQAASLLYQAVLCSEMPINERDAGKTVPAYAEPSLDADVTGNHDLIFTNSTQSPVYLEAAVGAGNIRITIYGESDGSTDRSVGLVSQVTDTTAIETRLKADDSAEYGSVVETKGQQGVTSECYLVIYRSGQEESRQKVSTDNYDMVPHMFYIGTQNADQETLETIRKAARAGDYQAAMQAVEQKASGTASGLYAESGDE